MTSTTTQQTQTSITLRRPAPGGRQVVPGDDGAILYITFPMQSADLSADGADLVFAFADGGGITVTDFFGDAPVDLPRIQVAGEEVLSGEEFLQTYDPALLASVENQGKGSGDAEYHDNPGALIQGLDKYGKLGTDYWGRESGQRDRYDGLEGQSGRGPVVLPGVLRFSFAMFEDGQPRQNTVADGEDRATGAKDTTPQSGYDSATGMPIGMSLEGAPAGVTVGQLVIGTLPSPSQGVIFYQGKPVTQGQVFTNPDMDGFTFKPAPNFSGDADFSFSYRLTSPGTGLAANSQNASAVLHVDSVADLPDATSEATGRMAEDVNLTAPDATMRGDGWAAQMVSGEPPFDLSFTVKADFGDLDGSEKGWIDVKLPEGFTIPADKDYLLVRDGADTYARIPVPDLATLRAANGHVEIPVTIIMGPEADHVGSVFEIRVVAQEQDALDGDGHSTGDNAAIRVIEQDITVALVPGTLTVSAGWAYEGDKSGGSATGDLSQIGIDPGSTTPDGAPIRFDFTGGTMTGGTVTIDPAAGELYLDGVPASGANGVYTFTPGQLSGGRITFMPAPGYTDRDVSVSYTIAAEGVEGNDFTISGTTTVVLDAVADVASGTAATALAAQDNTTLDVTVTAAFADTDGSERHYILIEKHAGWDVLDPHDTITVYYDADGNPLQPNGVDASTGAYTYDTASAASSKEFFRIDVTDQSGQAGGAAEDYVVRVRPDFSGGDVTLTTGTLAEEAYPDRSGYEHDVANNQAFTFEDVAVNLVTAAAAVVMIPAYEDHNFSQYLGSTSASVLDGNIVVGIFSGAGSGAGAEFIDTSAGQTITMTFTYSGGVAPGQFTFNGVSYALGDAGYVQTGAHTYQLTLPASALAQGSGSFVMRYSPVPDDDTDLTNVSFTVPVISENTGFKGSVTTGGRTLVVDAAADKPLQVGLSVDLEGNTAAVSGSTVEAAVQVRFGDYTDGSEQHYLVFDLGPGLNSVDASSLPAGYSWHVLTGAELTAAGLDKYADAGRYAVIQVPNGYLQQHGGLLDAPVRVGLDAVSKDSSLALDIIGVAVDTPSDGSDLVQLNNIAETPGTITIDVHVLSSNPALVVKQAYEDDMRLEHIGQDGSNGAPLSISGMDGSENLTEATISFNADMGLLFYNGAAVAPGTTVLPSGVTLTVALVDGVYTMHLSGGSSMTSTASEIGRMTFVPADNYSDRDVPLTFTGTVVDRGSGEEKEFGPKVVSVLVDAVAQQPGNADGSVSYEDGRTAAFDTLTLTATASFRDVADGTERHYLLIEAKSYFNTSGMTVTTVGYGANGQPLTPNIVNGVITGWLDPNPASGKDVTVLPNHTTQFIQIPVDAVIAQYDQAAGGEQHIGDFTVTRAADGSFSVSYTANIPVKTGSVASDITGDTVITGGMAVDSARPSGGDSTGGREGFEYNNVGYDFDNSTTVNVAVVETRIVTLLMGRASEQNAPAANVGDYTQADGAGILVVRETPAGGDYGNEQVTINFTYNALYQDGDGNWVLPGAIEYNGQPAVTSIDPATGVVTATVVVNISDTGSIINKTDVSTDPDVRAGQIDGSGIRFVPSSDTYNEADVNLRYTTSVEDAASGASMNMAGGQGTVLVDAVADLPVISNVAWAHDQNGQYTASSSPDVTLNLDVHFPDTGTNGVVSEGQYILVQKIPGMDLSDAFKAAVAAAGFTIDDHPEGGVLYYRIPAAYFPENPAGSHNYSVSLDMTLQGGVSDIQGFTPPDILAQAVVDTLHGGEIITSNNTAQAEVALPPLNFAVVNSTISGGTSSVYEGDTPDANTGDYTPAGGASFGLGLNLGMSLNGQHERTVGDIGITYEDTRGTLYYKVPDSGESSGFRMVAVQNNGSIPPEYANDLVFIPKDTGDSSADKDVSIHYTLTVEDPASGAQKTLEGDYGIIIDSVAEQPLNVTVDNVTYQDGTPTVGHDESITLEISATFPDYEKSADGHADHYILIQRPGEYWTIDAPGATIYTAGGETYFRIPVSSFDASGGVSVTVTLKSPPEGYLLYDNARPITVNAMTVDRDPGKGPLPDGDRGITYDNNWAYGDGATVSFTYDDPMGTKYFTVDPLYEDNTPYGNQLDTDGNPITTQGGGGVHLSTIIDVPDGSGGTTPKTVTEVTLTWTGDRGTLYIDGNPVTPVDNGDGTVSVTIPAGDFGKNITFRTPDNNSDQDFGTITGSFTTTDNTGPYTDTVSPIVDAVAQVPTNVSSTVDYGDPALAAVTPGSPVDINVSATFHDLDGSENLYVLVEVKPGWGNPEGYPVTTGPNGVAYYQVPVDPSEVDPATGQVNKTVHLTAPNDPLGGTAGDHGQINYNLGTGAMTVEDTSRPDVNGVPRGDEIRDDNNIAYNLGGSAIVTTSTAESTPIIHVTNAYAGSDRDGDGVPDTADSANVYITGLDPASDRISQVELSYQGGHGELQYNGQPLEGMPGVSVSTDASGKTTVIITDSGLISALTSGGAASSAVHYVSTDANAADVTVTGKVSVSDLFSGDSKEVSSGGTIIVDAVAQHPENVSVTVATSGGSVQANASVPVSVTGSFPDMGAPGNTSQHVLGVQQVDGWTLDGPLPVGVSIQTYNGVTYYAIDVDVYGDGGSPALTKNPDGSYTFNITLKAPDATHDVPGAASITGGAVTIADEQNSAELTYSNNLSVVSDKAALSIGVVETTNVDFTFAPVGEDNPQGSAISLDVPTQNALNSHNEMVTDTTLTISGDFTGKNPGDTAGTIIYDGKAYPVTVTNSGTATAAVDFGPDGYDASKDFRVVWGTVQTDGDGNVQLDGSGNPVVTEWNHTGQNMTVSADSTVVDKASGATESVGGQGSADFSPAADGPSGVSATDPDGAVGAGQQVTFTVSGYFADTDGSELHYFLVEQQPGWTGGYNTISLGGKNYFMVPVISTNPSPSITVTLTTPEDITADTSTTLQVGGMAKDGSVSNVTMSGNESTITIGVVTATGVNLAMANTDEDVHTQMQFSLAGGDNDAISSITVTDLQGGVIVDADGRVLFSGAPAVLDVQTALGGGYYYLPPANADGNFSVGFHAVVTDQASGASKEFDGGAGDVAVAPVTDAPESATGVGGSPVFEAGHTARVPVQLLADFEDTDGSESHFFLVVLPGGASAPSGWSPVTDTALLDAAGLSGQTVYRVEADASGSSSFSIGVGEHYGGGDITYVAGSVEKANLADGNPDYQFTGHDTVTIPATGEINLPPEAQNIAEHAGGLSGNELNGAFNITDPDGDYVVIAGVNANGGQGTLNSDGSYMARGAYGDFVVNPDGSYTYNLFDPNGSGQDVMEITLTDPYGATSTSSVSVDVTPVSGSNPLAATHFGLYLPDDGFDAATASAALDPLTADSGDIDLSGLPVVSRGDLSVPDASSQMPDADAFVSGVGHTSDIPTDAAAVQGGSEGSGTGVADTPVADDSAGLVPYEIDQSTTHEEEAAEILAEIKSDFGG